MSVTKACNLAVSSNKFWEDRQNLKLINVSLFNNTQIDSVQAYFAIYVLVIITCLLLCIPQDYTKFIHMHMPKSNMGKDNQVDNYTEGYCKQ